MAQTVIVTADKIISMADDAPQAFSVIDGRVAATGLLADLRQQHPDAEVVDFGSAVVVPGFHDAHMHLGSTADSFLQVDLSYPNVQSLSEVTRRIRDRGVVTAPGGWIIGSRLRVSTWTKSLQITRSWCDRSPGIGA